MYNNIYIQGTELREFTVLEAKFQFFFPVLTESTELISILVIIETL